VGEVGEIDLIEDLAVRRLERIAWLGRTSTLEGVGKAA
jgi:hypothetical protein